MEKRKNLGGFAKPLIIHRDQTTRITKRYYHTHDPIAREDESQRSQKYKYKHKARPPEDIKRKKVDNFHFFRTIYFRPEQGPSTPNVVVLKSDRPIGLLSISFSFFVCLLFGGSTSTGGDPFRSQRNEHLSTHFCRDIFIRSPSFQRWLSLFLMPLWRIG